MPSYDSFKTETLKSTNISFLTKKPTSPEPVLAFLWMFVLLYPNQVYPSRCKTFLPRRWVSAISVMSMEELITHDDLKMLLSVNVFTLQPRTFQNPAEIYRQEFLESLWWDRLSSRPADPRDLSPRESLSWDLEGLDGFEFLSPGRRESLDCGGGEDLRASRESLSEDEPVRTWFSH